MKKMLLIISFLSLFLMTGLSAEIISLNSQESNAVTVTVLESNSNYTLIEMNLNNFSKQKVEIDNHDYYLLNLKSEGVSLNKGMPALPLVGRSIAISPDAKMSYEIIEVSYSEITGHIAPSKGSLLRNVNPNDVPYEFSDIYKLDEFYPKSLIDLGEPYIFRDIRGLSFRVTPFAYNPVQGIIKVYDKIVVKIYNDGIDTVNVLNRSSNKISKPFVSLYRNHFINYTSYRNRYETIEEQGTILVISYPAFMDAIQPYVDWKNQKGIPTVLVSTQETGTTTASIQSFITNYWNTNPDVAFIQLVGDAPQIPTPIFAGGGSDPSYVMLAGNDHYPELFIGRFSAETIAQVETQVERTIYYERDIIDGEWLSKGTGVASNEGPGDNGEYDHQHLDIIRNLLLDYTYDHVDQFYQPQATAAQVTNALNDGRSFINYTGHGSQTTWVTTGFSNNHINALTNDNKLPFIVTVACVNGDFTGTTCFAEAWLRATNNTTGAPTGAVNIYAATINQPWYEPMRAQDVIVELLVDEEKNTIGGLFFNGASAMLDVYPGTGGINTMRTWHIFGDAALQVRTTAPLEMVIDAPETFFIGLSEYSVTVDIEDALVSLYRHDTQELIGFAYSNVEGEATIYLEEPLTEPCILTLTVSGYNRITDIREISVIPNEGPYLVYNSVSFPEGHAPNFGSLTGVNLQVYNVGSENAQNVNLTLVSNDQYINVINPQTTVALIESEQYYDITDTFTFKIANNVPDQHSALFTLLAQDSENIWTMNFRITLNAPVLAYGEYMIIETTGNNNNRLDPGETAEIHIPFINTGHANSSEASIVMFSNNPYIYIEENSIIVPSVESQGTSYAVYTVTADENIEPGSRVSFGYFAEFTSAQFQSSFDIPVGLLIEDFETGDLEMFEWANNSMNPWYIVEDEVYEGNYSLRSGSISHNQTSTLSISRTLTSPGIISFWFKVSSEQVHDKLQFYLNNAVLNSWSGEIDWTYVEFELPAGTHTLRWVYRKDASNTAGLDCAWIDYITFPLSGGAEYNGPVLYVNTESIEFNDVETGGTYISDFTLVNFGNTMLQGTITVPTGFNIYDARNQNSQTLNYFIAPNNNKVFNLVFRPTQNIEYDGFINITSNDPTAPNDSIQIVVNYSTSISDTEIPNLVTSIIGNYPNPFNPETSIRFSTDTRQNIEISVYNVKGQLVKTLANDVYDKGFHSVVWNGKDNNNRNVASGVYFYKFSTPELVQVRKMLLMK